LVTLTADSVLHARVASLGCERWVSTSKVFSCDRVNAQLDSKQLSCSCAFGFAKVNAQKEVYDTSKNEILAR
jgi:hypothetical protein